MNMSVSQTVSAANELDLFTDRFPGDGEHGTKFSLAFALMTVQFFLAPNFKRSFTINDNHSLKNRFFQGKIN